MTVKSSKNTVHFVLTGVLVVVFIFAFGITSKQGSPRVIKIVSSLPRTGSAQGQTDSIVNGIRLALEEASHKVVCDNGETFEIVYQDKDDATAAAGQWDASAETTNAKKAAAEADVMIYIGTFNSGAAKLSMYGLNKARILMISPANTYVGLTKRSGVKNEPLKYRPSGKVNFTRVVATDDLQGSLAADWAKSMGVKRVFVLDDNELYGAGLGTVFNTRSKEIGLEVLGHEHIDTKATDFVSLMTKIKALQPDLIYFGGTSQSKAGQVAKDIRSVGMKAKLMVPDGCKEEAFIHAAGEESLNESCYVTFVGLPYDQLHGIGAQFYKNYKEKYKKKDEKTGKLVDLEPEPYAVYGYEACKVALAAIKQAGKKDREAIIEAALQLTNFEGAFGKYPTTVFDENGDTTVKNVSGSIVRHGEFQFTQNLRELDTKKDK